MPGTPRQACRNKNLPLGIPSPNFRRPAVQRRCSKARFGHVWPAWPLATSLQTGGLLPSLDVLSGQHPPPPSPSTSLTYASARRYSPPQAPQNREAQMDSGAGVRERARSVAFVSVSGPGGQASFLFCEHNMDRQLRSARHMDFSLDFHLFLTL